MKLTDILKDSGIELGKVYTDKDRPPFQTPNQINEGSLKIGKGEFKSMIDVEITTQAEYDALPSGAIFTQPGVGRRRKP